MIKTLNKLDTEESYLNVTKTIEEATTNIIFKDEKLKAFHLRSKTRQGGSLLTLLLNIALEFLTRAIKQEKDMKGIQIGEEEVKFSLFEDELITYIENRKDSTKTC